MSAKSYETGCSIPLPFSASYTAVGANFRELSLDEFQQFRSRIEPLVSEEEIREEIRTTEEDREGLDHGVGHPRPL